MISACMISSNGVVIPVDVHPYMDYDFVQMNLLSGLWFYEHTEDLIVKQAYIDLIVCYAKDSGFDATFDFKELLKSLETLCNNSPDFAKFLKEHNTEIERSFNNKVKLKEVLDILVKESNQEFMRVRYGGVYKTEPGNRDIYFRISSVGFNWYNIIWQFVYDHKASIDFVTIVRDLASTNSGEFYQGKSGIYDRMPVNDFLMETGNPVIEWKDKLPTVRKHLATGGTIQSIDQLPMNPDRAQAEFILMQAEENARPRFWSSIDYVMNPLLEGAPNGLVSLTYE